MSEKSRYFKIGLFTIVSLVLLCVGLIMFGAGSSLQAPPLILETYFTGSVQGLDVGALVKMSGVRIGKVKDILFVKDVYGKNKTMAELNSRYTMVYIKMEIESKYFPKFRGLSKEEAQKRIDYMVEKETFRAKLESIGITGLVYVELGFYNPNETPPPMKIDWKPMEAYIPSSPGLTTRLGASLEKFMNKLDTDVYPMLSNLNKASENFPSLTKKIDTILPHLEVISKNIEDITSTGKKYPSSMIFGDAPPKSRFDQ
jgi:ABC-type transporter Mla subunit MlaD